MKKIEEIKQFHIPVGTFVDNETYIYLKKESEKYGISITHIIMHILKNEKEKAARRPKVVVTKE